MMMNIKPFHFNMYRQTLLFIFLATFLISCGGGTGTPDPEITGITPDSGPPGSMVTIAGNGFSSEASGNAVTFGGTSAEIGSASESQLQVTVPELDPGPAPVAVSVGEATASGPNFTVEQGAPGISAVEPDSGTVGTEITIIGMNFSATASENTITFNGTSATVKSATETELVADVPQDATDGPIEVTVGQKSAIGPNFDVLTEGTLEVVTFTSGSDLDPDGYTVTVGGTNNKTIGVNSTVSFKNIEQGSYEITLTGLASNCSVDGDNPVFADITAEEITTVTIQVACKLVLKDKIVFGSDRKGSFQPLLWITLLDHFLTDNALQGLFLASGTISVYTLP